MGRLAVTRISDTAARRRGTAMARLKILVPALFIVGFLFYAAITVFPLAGMPGPPPDPFRGTRALLLWLATACACGALFGLFGGLVVALSAGSDEDSDG